jgi:hypothetical protein
VTANARVTGCIVDGNKALPECSSTATRQLDILIDRYVHSGVREREHLTIAGQLVAGPQADSAGPSHIVRKRHRGRYAPPPEADLSVGKMPAARADDT